MTLPTPQAYGRPPGIPTRRCTHISSNGYPCRGGALWLLLPEAEICQAHIPLAFLPAYAARRTAWAERGAQLWADICTEHPTP